MNPLFSDPILSEQIAHMEEWPAKEGDFVDLPSWLDPTVRSVLRAQGVQRLFSHQAAAIESWRRGEHVAVSTGANSGKSLCYSVPALQIFASEPAARALLLFPTKALAQDQMARLRKLQGDEAVRVETYDGDTPQSHRSSIRRQVNALITNPDMLHVGILPNHENWSRFFKSLRLIAIDEVHVYRGVFGSHVGNIVRRLLRVCEIHGSFPQIVACSATIGNLSSVFQKLTGSGATLVDRDGSPKGRRTFIFWNPPEVGGNHRMSANLVTSQILCNLVEARQRSLAFSRSRVGAELVLQYTRRAIGRHGGTDQKIVDSYRAGYSPKERRQIESGLFNGKLMALSSTNALELGVDVGMLDAVVMNGYPGSSSSFWQQAGRAGRGLRDGIAIMVAHDDPLEQFLIRSPDLLLKSEKDGISLDPGNPEICRSHLLCTAYECPIGVADLARFGTQSLEIAEELDRKGDLQFRSGRFFLPAPASPAPEINIRGAGGEQVILEVDGVPLGSMEEWRALMQAHGGAVYLHRGETFLVEELDLTARRALLRPAKVDYYTQAVVQSALQPSEPLERRSMPHAEISVGRVTVTEVVTEFRRRSLDGDQVLDVTALELPAQSYETFAVRFDLPSFPFDEKAMEEIGGVHAIEHALLAVAPLLAGCDRGDLGSVWYSVLPETTRPAVFIIDRVPGGVGLAWQLFRSAGGWLKAALQLLESCPCITGCPSCLLSARCECSNETLSKSVAVRILRSLS